MAALPAPETPDTGALDRATIARVLRNVAEMVESLAPATDVLRAAQTGRDVLDTVRVAGVAELVEGLAHEEEGASTVTTWARRELRIDPHETAKLRRTTHVATVLPQIGRAAEAGQVRLEHLTALAYGIKHLGAERMAAAEDVLLETALTHEPGALLRLIKKLRAHLFPDDLDDAWAAGMDKEDLRLTPCGEGFHVTGFLSATLGAKFAAILENLSAPRGEGDDRTPAERRMQGLEALFSSILDSGTLPADRGVRPHVTVTIPVDFYAADPEEPQDEPPPSNATTAGGFETGSASASPSSTTDLHPATAELRGFGPIGPALAGYLACLGDTTPVITAGNQPDSGVLDVGRTRRVATLRQRKAVEAHQGGVCATPGCELPIEEIHHITWWSAGGHTDLINLIGPCKPCHRLIHQGKLIITVGTLITTTGDPPQPGVQPHVSRDRTYRFTNRHGQPVTRRAGTHLLAVQRE